MRGNGTGPCLALSCICARESQSPKPTPNPPVCEAEQGCALAAPRCGNWGFGCWMSFLHDVVVPQPLTPLVTMLCLGGSHPPFNFPGIHTLRLFLVSLVPQSPPFQHF